MRIVYAVVLILGLGAVVAYHLASPSSARAVSPAFQHIGILSLEFHVDKLSRPLL